VKLELLREIAVDNAALLSELKREKEERQRLSAEAHPNSGPNPDLTPT